MTTVEFQAKVENGEIVIPNEYQQDVAEVQTVKIIVTKQPKKRLQPDIMDELAQNPIPVPGIRAITRDEMHD